MPPPKVFTDVMETRFTPEQSANIRAEAAASGESYSTVVRRAVDAYFAKCKRRKAS